MNAFIKQTGQRWLAGAVKNPKRFYMYSMIFLSVSFTGSLIQGIFFPSDTSFKIKTPCSLFQQGRQSESYFSPT